MNRQQTTLFIADTSNGFDFQVLPETHKRYRRLIASALARPLKTQEDWEILGRALITVCEYANAGRQIDVLSEASALIVSLPVRTELRTIGLFNRALALHRNGNLETAQTIYEQLAADPRFPWKPKAVAAAAGCHFDSGDLDTATHLYSEVQCAAANGGVDLASWLKSQWMLSVIRSAQGDHNSALLLLESIEPVVSHVAKIHGAICYDYLNSLAVLHAALNHLDQAERLNRITLASPWSQNFAYFYDTRDEIQQKRDAAAATVLVLIDGAPEEPRSEAEQFVSTEHITIASSSHLTPTCFYRSESQRLDPDPVITLSLHRGDGTPGLPMLLRLRHTIEPRAR
jgi:hypothetical protein